jgi:pseudouridine synthase
MGMRLVKYLAHCGVASRRGAADLVRGGLVRVNGIITTNVAHDVEPDDKVSYRERPVHPLRESVVLMLNKPVGVVCSASDPHNPETTRKFLPEEMRDRVKPVGRLDKNTTGLLLMTDDGDLSFRLTHPRHGVDKTYRAVINGGVDNEALEALRNGVRLEDGPTAPAEVRVCSRNTQTSQTVLEIAIHEGRNRQVRRMIEAVGHSVRSLKRVRFGPLALGDLPESGLRKLDPAELRKLYKCVGLTPGGDNKEKKSQPGVGGIGSVKGPAAKRGEAGGRRKGGRPE